MENTIVKQEEPRVAPSLTKKAKGWNFQKQLQVLPIIMFFIIWEGTTRLNMHISIVNPVFFPPPSLILIKGWELCKSGLVIQSVLSSTIRIFIGFLLGALFAIVIALLMGRVKKIEFWFTPIFNMIGPIPALALLPLFIIWFGIGEIPKIVLIAWTTFFPVMTNTLDGIKSVNSSFIRSALSLGANERQIYTKIIIPSTLPFIIAGCQISLGLAFSALVVSEMMGAKNGLGYIIVDARNYMKMLDMYVAIVLIGLEYSFFAFIFKLIEKKLLDWRTGGFHHAIEK
ncbi:nitrate/sulfonate/bicarbonate ABC transporter permease [Bacillus methanolicus PB1]|uniref:Nitrate/sulfonate/bicarbonate ABC transporter permease n=1 Tax=Bacillus methanolicus PB1 TaxID=997296 RepID=I3E1R5_BACMT|nr:ABC transporter permease [Bacillus methanolicus]EIJ80436.1 nitrate/sulfonate/bicarbonate ABC transporter permease [Bacillus methanolicus PB1]